MGTARTVAGGVVIVHSACEDQAQPVDALVDCRPLALVSEASPAHPGKDLAMNQHTVSLPTCHSSATRAGARSASLRAALAAAVLGLAIVWTVGFAPLSALHNAAHDTRHSAAFPCH